MTADTFTIGVDLGGTNLRSALIPRRSGFSKPFSCPRGFNDGPQAVAERHVARPFADCSATTNRACTLLESALAHPGRSNCPRGFCDHPPNLPGWDGFELRATVERALGLPDFAAKRCERRRSRRMSARPGQELGVLIRCACSRSAPELAAESSQHGKIWDGMTGMAGEVGHLNIWTEGGMACGCGSSGCLEAHASATGVRKLARTDDRARRAAQGLRRSHAMNPHSTHEMSPSWRAPAMPTPERFLKKWVARSGIGLASLVNVLNLPLYVLGRRPGERLGSVFAGAFRGTSQAQLCVPA